MYMAPEQFEPSSAAPPGRSDWRGGHSSGAGAGSGASGDWRSSGDRGSGASSAAARSVDGTVTLDATTDLFAAVATCVAMLVPNCRAPFLPLDMKGEDRKYGKLREEAVLRHPLRQPAGMRSYLNVRLLVILVGCRL